MYIKPPRGEIQLDELTECVTTRFQYFIYKYHTQETQEKPSFKFQYLTLGTALDRVGHFTLRLLAAHSEDLRAFVSSSEALFVVERLEFSTRIQIIQLLSTSLRHLEEAIHQDASCRKWRSVIFETFNVMKGAFKSSHMTDFKHDEKCNAFIFQVPFYMCLKMVANRQLQLEKGNVLVPCGKWKSFLNCFMEDFFNKEIKKMSSSLIVKESLDERLNELKHLLLNLLNRTSESHYTSSKEEVRSDQMNELQKLFPPCMASLYHNLRTNHRLSHYARFNFSLFLKDIGMSLNESIKFWRSEYSKPGKCGNKCLHSWQKDSAKYIYSIRHLYGLEGKRAKYCVPSCSKIQRNNLGPIEEGGCPFQTFDANKLHKCLDPEVARNKEKIELIMHLKSSNCVKACDYYRRALGKEPKMETIERNVLHRSPVEYFNLLRNDLFENPAKD